MFSENSQLVAVVKRIPKRIQIILFIGENLDYPTKIRYKSHIPSSQSTTIWHYRLGLFTITKAAITPGTQPHNHNKKTIKTEPHPLSKTAKGGQIIDTKTLQILIKKLLLLQLYVLADKLFVTRHYPLIS